MRGCAVITLLQCGALDGIHLGLSGKHSEQLTPVFNFFFIGGNSEMEVSSKLPQKEPQKVQ